jgi:hypothetical protein
LYLELFLQYGIEGEPHSFVLEISWPESYPESLPDINLDAFYNKHMQDLMTPLT